MLALWFHPFIDALPCYPLKYRYAAAITISTAREAMTSPAVQLARDRRQAPRSRGSHPQA